MKQVSKIISGGQTGSDIAGLRWAKKNGKATGGFIPKGFKTEDGPKPQYREKYGMLQTTSDGYASRTRLNIEHSDGTLIFGDPNSSGSAKTIRDCMSLDKPYFIVIWPYQGQKTNVIHMYDSSQQNMVFEFRDWIRQHDIKTLNVAGNRESVNPGVGVACYMFLDEALKDL